MYAQKRKLWLPQEDDVLKYLREEKGIKRWKKISEILNKEYGISGRNQKQCRDRYQNHLKESNEGIQWTEADEEKLLNLRKQYGHKWTLISVHFPSRNGSFIKNKFYSKLRKGLRKVNQIILASFPTLYREIEINTLFQISNLEIQKQEREKDLEGFPQIDFENLINELLEISNDSFSIGKNMKQNKKNIQELIERLIAVENLLVSEDQIEEISNSSSQSLYQQQFVQIERKRAKVQNQLKSGLKKTVKKRVSAKQILIEESKMKQFRFCESSSEKGESNNNMKKSHREQKSAYAFTTRYKEKKESNIQRQMYALKEHRLLAIKPQTLKGPQKFKDQDLEPLVDFIEEQQFPYDNQNSNSVHLQQINSTPKSPHSISLIDGQSCQSEQRFNQNETSHDSPFEGNRSRNSEILNQINMDSSEQVPFTRGDSFVNNIGDFLETEENEQ